MDFDCRELDPKQSYKLLISIVVPRPIAFVTTQDAAGNLNAAPFSFFNAMGFDPPVVALGIEARPDGTLKDTARNIRDTGEFVVNLVDEALAERMNLSAVDFPPGMDEVAITGLTPVASINVAPPRLEEAPASLECIRIETLHLNAGRHLVVGEVIRMHVRDDAVDTERLHIDMDRLGLIGRGAGSVYFRTSDRFDLRRKTYEEWQVSQTEEN